MQDEDHELLSETETDILLSDLPVDLIKESLKFQIQNPLSTNVNYVENMVDRYRVLRAEFDGNTDAISKLDSMTIDFYEFIIEEIDEVFDLSLNTGAWDGLESAQNIALTLYSFMVLKFRKNITRYLHRFITKNKKDLISSFGPDDLKKKDVTSIAIKKKIKNKDDIQIISNLPSLISHTLNLDIDPMDFISYVAKDDNYEASIIRNLILEGNLLGNFVKPYFEIIRNEYDGVLDEIHTDVKMKLLKKL